MAHRWTLLDEMEVLWEIWRLQAPPSLPPEDWLKDLKEQRDRLWKLLMQPPPELQPHELQRLGTMQVYNMRQ